MALTLLLAAAAPPSRPPRLTPGELLWTALPLIGILLFAALVLYFVDRWRKRAAVHSDACTPNDQLSHFRSLYERGEMSPDDFEKVKALLAGELRKEMNVPAPPAAAGPQPADTNIQASPPGPQSPPSPEEPKA
jgi:hypothetical protein